MRQTHSSAYLNLWLASEALRWMVPLRSTKSSHTIFSLSRPLRSAALGKPRPMRDKPARRRFGAHSNTGPGMSLPVPALADFRRIVVKVGSSLLVDSDGRPGEATTGSPRWPTTSPRCTGEGRDVLVVSSGAIALGRAVLKLPRGRAQARGLAGRRRGRPDRARAHLGGGARRATASPPARCW